MGLFGGGESLSEDFRAALADDAGHHRRMIAKGEPNIRSCFQDGETVRLIAVEDFTATHTLVVTDRRLLVMRKGGRVLDRSVTPEEIRDVEVRPTGTGSFLLVVAGPGTTVKFQRPGVAYSVGEAIEKLARRRPPVETAASGFAATDGRAVPILYPGFYLDLLTETGVPANPENVVNLIERVFVMVMGQADEYFRQWGDDDAARRFHDRFDGGGPEDRVLNSVDDMVDWLWAWNFRCHTPLMQLFPRIQALLLEPHSFLRTGNGRVPSWAEYQEG
ncbi:hypothetical protein [Amycolatopsis tolypomycina]|uniref:hypothetical protein n=1 Tax=Amycolatopsis tolypomycina TaxID=208445 RepID=UPI00115FAB8D|nr:hypothetical protein [Amycolatopsis tolypomycina]